MATQEEVKTVTDAIGSHYARQATPEVWAEVDELRKQVERLKPAPWTDQEHYYLHSILRSLQGLNERVCEEWQGVSLQSEALADNIDWLDCFITTRCVKGAACEQCWPNRE